MSLSFIMTQFIYPIDKSDKTYIFGKLYFDNPRTTQEVNYVAEYLKELNKSNKPCFADKEGQVPGDCVTILSIYDFFYKNNKKDEAVEKFHNKYGKLKDIYKKLARLLVIIRSDEVICEEDTKGKFALIHESDELPLTMVEDFPFPSIEYNRRKIYNYFSFITFMLGDGYIGDSLIHNDCHRSVSEWGQHIFIRFLIVSSCKNSKRDVNSYPYANFKYLLPRIAKLSEQVGEKYKDKKFLFICEKIKYSFENYNNNLEMSFVELISLIELLITHNPDSGRFNIEESITKQFVGKMLLILYENDNKIDSEKLKKELKFTYSIRSAIAHGDYINLNQQLNKLFDFYGLKRDGKGIDYKDNSDALIKLRDRVTDWLRVVVSLYLKDENKINIIKAM